TRERTAFGQPIASFGMLRDRLARMASLLYAVESTVYRVASVMERALTEARGDASALAGTERLAVLRDFALECALAKSFASESLGVFTDDMLQLYGGYGFSEEYPAAKAFRDARVTRLYEGTTEICRVTVMQRLLAQCGESASTGAANAPCGVAAQKELFRALLQRHLEDNGGETKALLAEQTLSGPFAAAFERIYAAESVLLRAGEAPSSQRDLAAYFVATGTSANLACMHQISGSLSNCAAIGAQGYEANFPAVDVVRLRERVVEALRRS
ncbi:MAG: hypothetical protein L3K26_16455, partial [Candidatus Hydrogenedentes bacterium]|nr:hypothetical protein [Candidatus Hydrogenedentota bacterium]